MDNNTLKLKWIDGQYNGARFRIANGFIQGSVHWDATVAKGQPTGYKVNVNGVRLTHLFDSIDEAKQAAERLIMKKLKECITLFEEA